MELILITIGMTSLVYILDWYKLKPSIKKRLRYVVLVLLLVSGYCTFVSEKESETEIENKGKLLIESKNLLIEAEGQRDSLRKENKVLRDSQIIMLADIKTMSNRLELFMPYIAMKYPNKDIDDALKMFNQELESTIQRVTSIEDGTKQRLITTEQERILIDNLLLIKELSKIYISYDASDLESRNYALQLSSVINKANADIDTCTKMHKETSHSKGIIILSKSAESDILQDKISKVFFKANINHKCARGNINDDFDITIKIGPN